MNASNSKAIPYNTLRLVSLFLALLLWVLFSGRTQQEEPEGIRVRKMLEVPLVYTGQPSSMEIRPSVFSVFVSMSGNEAEMKTLSGDMLMVKLDLSQLNAGSHQVPLPDESVEIPMDMKSLKIEAIQPRFVRFDFEQKIRKTLKVIVRPKGTAAPNFELERIDVLPSEVTIYGPESELKDLAFLIGEPIDISGLTEDTQGKVDFNYDKHFPVDTTMEEGINLTYRAIIREIIENKKLGSFKPAFDGWSPDIKFKPRSVKVTLKGPVTVVDKIQKEWLKITIPAVLDEEIPDQLPLAFKWELPVDDQNATPENEKASDEKLGWTLLSRLEEVEVLMEPDNVEVKK